MHLLEMGPYQFLFDCGLHRGPRDEARALNSRFSFDPANIDAIFLSHAHVDHCGNIPNLVRQGFSGTIYCTHATRDLIDVMLRDSARIQQRESAYRGSARSNSTPLYGTHHVEEAIEYCHSVAYDEDVIVNPSVSIRFIDAGHILGSAIIFVSLRHANQNYSITFSGDLGRRGVPYLAQPSPLPPADLIICESTYGGKTHETLDGMAQKMASLVTKTVARGGKVLIPAFSLGRTQLVLHYLRVWMASGILPHLPIYVDSPLAQEIDSVHQQYHDYLEPEVTKVPCQWLTSEDDAWYRSTQSEPCILVASGGMCEGGRITQHLKYHIDDPRSTIILVSYQSPNSLGAQLLTPVPKVFFHGQTWNKWIEVAEVNGFSGHADKDDIDWLLRNAVEPTTQVRLVHGEVPQMLALTAQLKQMGFSNVQAPQKNDVVVLGEREVERSF
jgi:metallo-beta-lactamase family protein